jgi:glyoxylase-like metal-dependent hydrolase (beta-lactamase superfamily II)
LLRVALARVQTLRFLGWQTYMGERNRVIGLSDPFGAQFSLYFSARTGLLSKAETLVDVSVFSLAGELAQEFTYDDYRDVKGVKVPFHYVTMYGGEVLEDLKQLEIQINSHPAAALFEIPDGYEKRPVVSPSPDFTKAADGVYFVRAPYNSLCIAFSDYVLVVEAPINTALSEAVMSRIRELIPDKPIKYVVASHYHHDHIGGLRPYIAEGATIVTNPNSKGEIEKLASTPRPIRPDALSRNPRVPVIETFTDKRVFSDRTHTLELYNIGPNPHAAEIIITYLPKQKALYTPDVLDIEPGYVPPAHPDTIDFAEKLKKLGLDVETIIPAHGRFGSISDLNKALGPRKP